MRCPDGEIRLKTARLEIRATPEEKSALQAAAAASGRTLTEYVTACCLPGRDVSKALPAEAVRQMAGLRGDIGKAIGIMKLALASGVPEKAEVEKALRSFERIDSSVRKLIAETVRKLAAL